MELADAGGALDGCELAAQHSEVALQVESAGSQQQPDLRSVRTDVGTAVLFSRHLPPSASTGVFPKHHASRDVDKAAS
ncbi:MAG: hypothetical protein JNL79_33430 [Myxococcales bacterium]|nr:hypothetical protein [Myxococcales bacterium]